MRTVISKEKNTERIQTVIDFFTIKASELSEKKHGRKCMERVLGSRCNHIVCMSEKNQKTFLKPIAFWAEMLYTNKACVRR